jgi:hypothetical protein
MSPAIACVPPWALKAILELHGFSVVSEDEYNWMVEKANSGASEPLIIPKVGALVAVDVMMQVLIDAKLPLGTYLGLKEQVLGKNWGYPQQDTSKEQSA